MQLSERTVTGIIWLANIISLLCMVADFLLVWEVKAVKVGDVILFVLAVFLFVSTALRLAADKRTNRNR